jgi:hypothetical protein
VDGFDGTYRLPWGYRLVMGLLGAVCLFLAIGFLVGSVDHPEYLIGTVGLGAIGCLSVRPPLSSLSITDHALVVRNWPIQREIPWAEVEGVRFRWTGRTLIEREGRRPLGVSVLQANRPLSEPDLRSLMATIQSRSSGAAKSA